MLNKLTRLERREGINNPSNGATILLNYAYDHIRHVTSFIYNSFLRPLYQVKTVSGAGSQVVTHFPLTPVAWVQLADTALSSLTQATILLGSVKCEATSKQRMAAVENCGCKCFRCGSALEGIKRVGGR